MRREAQPPTGGIYRPRNPRASPLYQCVRRHRDELNVSGLITRPVEAQVLERFLACGLHHGFARGRSPLPKRRNAVGTVNVR